ncbi:hypothetical protein ANN_21684 [Periplaneta americana]|uniref:Uncharacterized protein n=1 Tax=Periplaneta americana TaxID=6978 RepID=A0ABQ8S6M3_PERAM|nr:hypothetical protein ANN_21684 [Periplaneta americana]
MITGIGEMDSGAVFCSPVSPVSICAHLMDVKEFGEGGRTIFTALHFRKCAVWRWWSDVSQSKQASLVYRSSTRVCVRNCVSIRRPEFECSGPQLEGPEFECSGPQLDGPEFEYSGLSLKLGGQHKSWCPHKVCRSCFEELKSWKNGKKKSMSFGIPMIWREPTNHGDDCYFCAVKVVGYIVKNKKDILYPNIPSAIRPVPHGRDIPVPVHPESDMWPSASSSTETESPVDHTYEPDNTGDNRCF